ncbi:hypothetical protein PtB15_7B710 [Puccinia triticina]|nr:hypothetical protein PtB15_7B710 [Puccinia triticina]
MQPQPLDGQFNPRNLGSPPRGETGVSALRLNQIMSLTIPCTSDRNCSLPPDTQHKCGTCQLAVNAAWNASMSHGKTINRSPTNRQAPTNTRQRPDPKGTAAKTICSPAARRHRHGPTNSTHRRALPVVPKHYYRSSMATGLLEYKVRLVIHHKAGLALSAPRLLLIHGSGLPP